MKQLPLLTSSDLKKPLPHFGGALLKGRRKSKRPLSRKHAIHLVLKSSQARGRGSFLRHKKLIEHTLKSFGRRFGVKVYQLAVVSNHLHAVIRIHDRINYVRFINAVSGVIALKIIRGAGLKLKPREFWEARPFTRILSWGRDYQGVKKYLVQNTLEALGFIPYRARANNSKYGKDLSRLKME